MRRHRIEPRTDYKRKVEQLGLFYHRNEEGDYWNDSAYYEFAESEIDALEEATEALHRLCLRAVDHVVERALYPAFGIDPPVAQLVEASWREREPWLYGRFDLAFNGVDPPKLLEYNADTPTSLIESAVVQWHWLQEVDPEADQFNSIWEGLVERWAWLKSQLGWESETIHFCSAESVEDFMTITALQDTAMEAGLVTESLLIEEIGWNSETKRFVDLQDRKIGALFKLYPWEFLVSEPFGQHILYHYRVNRWIEPIWKMVLSNKAILPVLWQLDPDCPYLVEAYFDHPNGLDHYVRKPILAREGAGISVQLDGVTVETGAVGPSSGPISERAIFQRYVPLPEFEGSRAVIGSWVIGDEARGIGIRESDGLITNNLSRFVPHLFR